MIKAVIKNKKKFEAILKATEKKFTAAQKLSVQEATLALHSRTVKLIQVTSSGVKATRYRPKRTVTVSKPGDAPNTDTGRLIQSMKFDFKNQGLQGRVGSNLKYAKSLEFGTSIMAPRPFLSTAIALEKANMKKIFQANMKKATQK